MARLREDFPKFTGRGAVILAVGPDGPKPFRLYWQEQRLPFTGLPDPDHRVANLYKQQVKIFKWGRMPLVTVVDAAGRIRYAHYGASMSDIPSNELLLEVIDRLNAASN